MDEDNKDAKNESSPAEQRETFWKRLKGINAGMLGVVDDLKFVPMSHQVSERDDRTLWFITA